MTTTFKAYGRGDAPSASKALIEKSNKEWGFVPTLHGILAESAPTLEAYQTLFALGKQTSFTPAEQQVIYLAVSALNECAKHESERVVTESRLSTAPEKPVESGAKKECQPCSD